VPSLVTARLRCGETGFGFLGCACGRLMEFVPTFEISQRHVLDSAVRSGQPGVRIESVRALTAQTVLRARAGSRRCAGLDDAAQVDDGPRRRRADGLSGMPEAPR
jgi:hypothetical protein